MATSIRTPLGLALGLALSACTASPMALPIALSLVGVGQVEQAEQVEQLDSLARGPSSAGTPVLLQARYDRERPPAATPPPPRDLMPCKCIGRRPPRDSPAR